MTGRHMGHCRIRANRSVRGQDHLLASDLTVAEILKRAGDATGFVGKWGIGLPGTEGTPDRIHIFQPRQRQGASLITYRGDSQAAGKNVTMLTIITLRTSGSPCAPSTLTQSVVVQAEA